MFEKYENHCNLCNMHLLWKRFLGTFPKSLSTNLTSNHVLTCRKSIFLHLYFSVNSEFLTPLDVAVMTNNIPMAKMLLSHGARESPMCKSLTKSRWQFCLKIALETYSSLSCSVQQSFVRNTCFFWICMSRCHSQWGCHLSTRTWVQVLLKADNMILVHYYFYTGISQKKGAVMALLHFEFKK